MPKGGWNVSLLEAGTSGRGGGAGPEVTREVPVGWSPAAGVRVGVESRFQLPEIPRSRGLSGSSRVTDL